LEADNQLEPGRLDDAIRPYVETCIEAFGTRRSMFESNFPPDKVGFSYPVFWNACKLLTRGVSGTERADLFAGTAARFYRLNGIGWRPLLVARFWCATELSRDEARGARPAAVFAHRAAEYPS